MFLPEIVCMVTKMVTALHVDNIFDLAQPFEIHDCGVDPYCPMSPRSLHDNHCLVEPFEHNAFDFTTYERNMTWFLPISCPFTYAKEEKPTTHM